MTESQSPSPANASDITPVDPAHTGLSEAEVLERKQRGDLNVVVMRSSRTYKDIFQENVFFNEILVFLF